MPEAKLKEAPAAELPIWDGLYDRDADGPFIVGALCQNCGGMALGVREMCPHCHASGRMSAVPIGRSGTLYTATVIHQGPAGFAAPFRVGYVDVEGGVRVFAHLDNGPERPAIGDEVHLTIAGLQTGEDGRVLTGPFYVGAGGEA
ncbi:MAG: Zn-ribbon domain-containing OB-fold protein [bacterium]